MLRLFFISIVVSLSISPATNAGAETFGFSGLFDEEKWMNRLNDIGQFVDGGIDIGVAPTDGGSAPAVPSPSPGTPSPTLNQALGSSRIATRIFAGPNQYPPANYAAYGIIAFSSTASTETVERHTAICRAYLKALPLPPEGVPPVSQLVTVWPIITDDVANSIHKMDEKLQCEAAVRNYNQSLGQTAIQAARKKLNKSFGRGPFLIAWSPTEMIGSDKTVMLFWDLSQVDDYDSALSHFQVWVNDIQSDQWENGLTVSKLRVKIQAIINRYGQMFGNVITIGG
ncbi:hypothetical protein OQ273_07430 [Hoeflea prorocentri]|uniref:Uncharacterized protein n=2 Tax=Hoeflea prorocentri TaxID=1922333 RepID=A0A9X3UH62_9HYPH|nr:hypothetical protein [Hoeflea prorocentri]MDA5398402.1 hypothetical protein [Hoeflea prorocentri]